MLPAGGRGGACWEKPGKREQRGQRGDGAEAQDAAQGGMEKDLIHSANQSMEIEVLA